MGIDEHISRLMQEIDATSLLASRPTRAPNWRREAEALGHLAEIFADQPAKLAQALVDEALVMTGAHAAGISLDEVGSVPPVFRWVATAGHYAAYANATLPRYFSPCGEVLRRDAPVLMRELRKLYGTDDPSQPPAPQEALLVPFRYRGEPVGTLWVARFDDLRGFDAEDLRIVQTLTRFAGAAVESVRQVSRLTDVNAVQRAELDKRALQIEASHALDARKDHFIAVLAHEMRTPLSAITLNTQLLKLAPDDPQRRAAALAALERQAAQMTALIRDMTDVSAIRSGKLPLSRAPLNVQEIVAAALEDCGTALEAKGQRLEVTLPTEPLLLEGDRVRLTQVLVNLVNNAIKYTPRGGAISVRAAADAGAIELSVQDSGVGLAPTALTTVFDLYMQVPMEDRPLDSGLGIGLALVKQLIEMHGGRVGAASEGLGRGSTFSVRLPAA